MGGSTGETTECVKPTAAKDHNCGTPTVVSGSFTVSTNYFKVGPFAGYGFDYISPSSDATESVTCANSTFGSGKLTALCGAGIVPADCDTHAVGGVGFNLSQAKSSPNPVQPITTTVSEVFVEFTNTAGSDLRIQVVKNDGTTTTNYCYSAKDKDSPLTIQASEFTTQCYSEDDPGEAWDGTSANSVQLIIPSRKPADGETTFDVCLQNVELRE